MGEAIYIGRSPLVGRVGLLDTTRIALGEVDAVVYTQPDSGTIECIELVTDNQSDPAEIYFEKYLAIDGRQVPSQIRLAFGLENRTAMEVASVTWNSTPDSEAGK
jgi:hypothetical protein